MSTAASTRRNVAADGGRPQTPSACGAVAATAQSRPTRTRRPSPPAAPAAGPIADRDGAPDAGASPGPSSVPGPGGSIRPLTSAPGPPARLAVAQTGKMQT